VVGVERWGQCDRARWAEASLVASLACFWTSSLLAAPTLHQECKSLSADDSARVETRLFASLLAREAPGVSVSIACDDRIATVTASAGAPEQRRSVALSGAASAESILALAERALEQLLATAEPSASAVIRFPNETPPVQAETADARVAPAATPAEASRPPQRIPPAREECAPARAQVPPACAVHADSHSYVRVDAALESWGSHVAGGAAFGLEQRTKNWSWALLAGAARPFQHPSLSDITEWTAAAELGWQGAQPLGMRVSGQVGFSLLTVNPNQGVVTSSGTVKSAALFALDASRPIWLGRFALAPGLGLRFFSAKRTVSNQGQPEFELPALSVHVFLTTLFRVNE